MPHTPEPSPNKSTLPRVVWRSREARPSRGQAHISRRRHLRRAGLLSIVALLLGCSTQGPQPIGSVTTSQPTPAATGPANASVSTGLIAGGLSGASSHERTTETRPSAKPNIVVVMADDMRVDDLRYAPTVRQVLGEQGITFDNSFSPFPLCCPARASFLTGTYAHNHGVYWHAKPYGYPAFDDSRTIGTSLKQAGYNTAYVGKYLNGYGRGTSKVSGQPSYRYVPNGWTDWMASIDGGAHRNIRGSTYNYFNTPFNVNGRIDISHRGEYNTNVLGNFSTRLIRKYHQQSKPFFLYASFVAPHHGGPREPDDPSPVRRTNGVMSAFKTPARPDWVKNKFNKAITRAPGLPKNGGPSEADLSDKSPNLASQPELTSAERAALLRVTRQRAESIYVLDRQVQRIVQTLKTTREWNNTIIVFTSDNGYFLGEHRIRTGKVLAHEPSLRVPLLITGPGLRTGGHRSDPISTVDLTATLLDIANARPPRPADGTSRWATIRHGDQGWTTPIVTEAIHSISGPRRNPDFAPDDPRTSIGIRTARYSLSVYRTGFAELYDLQADPNQQHNRYRDPAYATVQTELLDLWRRYKDCAAQTCWISEPGFATAPAQTKALTNTYWSGVQRRYGTWAP